MNTDENYGWTRMKIPESVRNILTLTIICLVSASLLSGVYLLTRPRIVEQKKVEEQEALKEVLPEAGYFSPVINNGRTVYFKAYLSEDEKVLIGYAFTAQGKGYSSIIETVAAMDTQGRISGIKILSQNETPGLGARICEVQTTKTLWQVIGDIFSGKEGRIEPFARPWFCRQFKGKGIEDLIVARGVSERYIQAITGATISSKALTDSVRKKAKEVLAYERR